MYRYFGHYFKTPYQGRKRCFGQVQRMDELTHAVMVQSTQSRKQKGPKRKALCAKCCQD